MSKDEDGIMKPDLDCGLSSLSKVLGKKSECDKIEENIERYSTHLKMLEAKEKEFHENFPMTKELYRLDKFLQ